MRRRSRPRSPQPCWSAMDCSRCTWSRARARPSASDSIRRSSSATHHFVYGDIEPEYFMFNNPESACRTCGGLGVHKLTHPELLVPDPGRSIRGGCFVREAFKYNPDTWDGRVMYSLAKTLKFSLDTPWEKLPESVRAGDLERHRPQDHAVLTPRGEGKPTTTGRARRSASAGSPDESSGATAATGKEARQTRGWRPGSTA